MGKSEFKPPSERASVLSLRRGPKAVAASMLGPALGQKVLPDRVLNRVFEKQLRKNAPDASALSDVERAKIQNLYRQCGYWHGTGRYQYSAGRSHGTAKPGDIIDVLGGIIGAGGLLVRDEPMGNSKNEVVKTVSLAPSRMLARAYADTHAPNPESAKRFGSSFFWSVVYNGDLARAMLRECLHKKNRRNYSTNFAEENGVADWRRKVTQEPLPMGSKGWPGRDEFKRMNPAKQLALFAKGGAAAVDTFRTGSDIKNNYPILFGIRTNAVKARAATKGSIALHEVRSLNSITIDTDVTHLEVPQANIAETEARLAASGLAHVAVVALEDCEAYVSSLRLRDIYQSRLVPNAEQTIEGPAQFEFGAIDRKQPRFAWKPGWKYSAGLIPLRVRDDGQIEVLLLKRSRAVMKGNRWATPGGGCKPRKDKSPLVAAMRESEEELGRKLTGDIAALPIVLTNHAKKSEHHAHLLIVDADFEPKLNWENRAHRWVTLNELASFDERTLSESAAVLDYVREQLGHSTGLL
jgi:8-oxo-dGTP pyrophosphatase MutT (NUDIX family)